MSKSKRIRSNKFNKREEYDAAKNNAISLRESLNNCINREGINFSKINTLFRKYHQPIAEYHIATIFQALGKAECRLDMAAVIHKSCMDLIENQSAEYTVVMPDDVARIRAVQEFQIFIRNVHNALESMELNAKSLTSILVGMLVFPSKNIVLNNLFSAVWPKILHCSDKDDLLLLNVLKVLFHIGGDNEKYLSQLMNDWKPSTVPRENILISMSNVLSKLTPSATQKKLLQMCLLEYKRREDNNEVFMRNERDAHAMYMAYLHGRQEPTNNLKKLYEVQLPSLLSKYKEKAPMQHKAKLIDDILVNYVSFIQPDLEIQTSIVLYGYITRIYLPGYKTAIECEFSDFRESPEKEVFRDAFLASKGITVVRIKMSEYYDKNNMVDIKRFAEKIIEIAHTNDRVG